MPAAPPRGDVHGAAQDPWDSRFAATRTYERADAHAQHAPSADGVEDRLRELADTVKNLRASLSRDTTSDAVEQLSETVLGELRRRDAAPVAARSDADEMARRFERLERAVEDAVAGANSPGEPLAFFLSEPLVTRELKLLRRSVWLVAWDEMAALTLSSALDVARVG